MNSQDQNIQNQNVNDTNGDNTVEPVPFMNTLTGCTNKWIQNGYTDTLTVSKEGLYSTAKDKHYSPAEVKVIDFYRFEGQSDPADNSILYIVETADGVKGMVVDAYGAYADDAVTKFFRHVEEINKNVEKRDKSLDTDSNDNKAAA